MSESISMKEDVSNIGQEGKKKGGVDLNDTDDSIHFTSQEEEIEYYKSKYRTTKSELQFVTNSFVEFQKMSEDYEKQLEIDLETAEEREKDLKVKYNSLQEQLVETKESVSQTSTIFNQDLQKAIDELEFLKSEKKSFIETIQRLEQENDDLTKNMRISKASLETLREKLQKAVDDNILLKGELEALTQFKETIQRLKDEKKDLEVELSIISNKTIEADKTFKDEIVALKTQLNEKDCALDKLSADLAGLQQHHNTLQDMKDRPQSPHQDNSHQEMISEHTSQILTIAQRLETRLTICQSLLQ